MRAALVLGEHPLRVEDAEAVALGRRPVALRAAPADIEAARELAACAALWTLLGEPAC